MPSWVISMPCAQLLFPSHKPSPESLTGMAWMAGDATCTAHLGMWESVTLPVSNTTWKQNPQQIIPPSNPAKVFHHQATLKTQSDASAVAANLPKICSGNCLHRGRNKVWIFEYANLICRHEHVMGVSHSANAGCIQTWWAQPGLGIQGGTEGKGERMRRMRAVKVQN